MTEFKADFLEIEPRELVHHLLRESGQLESNSVDPEMVLRFLELQYLRFDFDNELFYQPKQTFTASRPRALISFPERVVAVDSGLGINRTRFSILHEIGHYVLPHHHNALFICEEAGLWRPSRLIHEKEANEFAADLLFMGDRFSSQSNSTKISAASIKELATKYKASLLATARRVVEKSFCPYMLVVFEKIKSDSTHDIDVDNNWSVQYCVASPLFKTRYGNAVSGNAPQEVVEKITETGRDFSNSIIQMFDISFPGEENPQRFRAEFSCNAYNILCLLSPVNKKLVDS